MQAGQRRITNGNFFFDGSRWVPRGDVSPQRPGPRGPEEFTIGGETDDEDEDADDAGGVKGACGASSGASLEVASPTVRVLAPSTKTSAATSAALVFIALLLCFQATPVVPMLPPAEESPPPAALRPRPPGTPLPGAKALVEWRGLTPVCPDARLIVGRKPVKLREAPPRESAEVAWLKPGTAVLRTGPCENVAGLVRVPVAVPSFDGQAGEPHGWATLTAEYVQGPRFFESAPDEASLEASGTSSSSVPAAADERPAADDADQRSNEIPPLAAPRSNWSWTCEDPASAPWLGRGLALTSAGLDRGPPA